MSARATALLRPAHPTGPARRPTISLPQIPLAYNVPVADVMSREPVTIGPDATLFDALVLMRIHDVTGLPVIETSGEIVGVLSQKDLARSLAIPVNLPDVTSLLDILMIGMDRQPADLLARLKRALEEAAVREAMARPPFVVGADAPLELAMEVMAEHGLSRLPVVEGRKLVGIVTPTDLIRAALRPVRRRD